MARRGHETKFKRLYDPNYKGENGEVHDADAPSKVNLLEKHLKRQRRAGQKNFLGLDRQQVDVSVVLETQTATQMLTQLSINSTFCSTYHPKVPQEPVKFDQVTVNIKEWGSQKPDKDQEKQARRRPMTRLQTSMRPARPAMKGNLTLVSAS